MAESSALILLGGAPTTDGGLVRAARLADIARLVGVLRDRGLYVSLATRAGTSVPLPGAPPLPAVALRAIDEAAYDALFVLDGMGSCLEFHDDVAFGRLVRRFDMTPRPLALAGSAIEAVAAVRRSDGAPMLRNRRIAASAGAVAERLRAAGAEPLIEPDDSEHVSVDTYLVTAQNSRSLIAAAGVVGAYFTSPARLRKMRAS